MKNAPATITAGMTDQDYRLRAAALLKMARISQALSQAGR